MPPTRIGKYQLVASIGRGATGEVHKAHDPVLGRFVAIKTISGLIDADEPQRQRFQREAQSAAQLNHPNIITIFDFGEDQGMAFIVMELLEGTDLKDLIDHRGLPRVEDKLAIMEQIADGLAFAHARGMVHRDLKPGNIHVLPTGQVKIMDFGLARRLADSSRTEEIQGTPNYMSPEQVKGERATPRSDIFSVGGVFYELLSNRRPFSADTIPAVLFNVVHRPTTPLAKYIPELPVLAEVVERCLAKEPVQRFGDAGELREGLRAVRQALGGGLRAASARVASLALDVTLVPSARGAPRDAPPVPGREGEDRELELLLERLRQETGTASPAAEESRSQLVAQALAAVAFKVRSGPELDGELERLRRLGVDAGMGQIFPSLGRALPDFLVPAPAGPAPATGGRELEAMRRIIVLAEEPLETARRFRELVYAAIDQFNQGHLGRAVAMIELADSLVREGRIDGTYVETIRNKGHESLEPARVRGFAESRDRHPLLREVLNFFFFGLGVPALLEELAAEERRDKRRLLLTLLQVHGLAARQTALGRLEAFAEGVDDPGPFLLRNLVHLLRLIPRPAASAPDGEIEIVAGLAAPGAPALLVREAVGHLGLTKHPKARQALIQLLRDYEARLARPDLSPEKQREGWAALDEICVGLARQGGARAWTEVVDHALGRRARLGDTTGRLRALSGHDLSAVPPLVDRLLGELEAVLPPSVIGLEASRSDHDALCLIEALSGTARPEVRDALESIVEHFRTEGLSRLASRVLDSLEPNTPGGESTSAGRTGELEPFGLPILLHRLGEPCSTGRLTLRDRQGRVVATLDLVEGRLVSCGAAALRGPEALYQLVERPFPGSFTFEAGAADAVAPPDGFLDVSSLTTEGIRRYGELRRASALVPDHASLEATGARRSSVPDETDHTLVVKLWERACAGVTPREIEGEIPLDPFRVRRALAHWVEEGALRRRPSPPAAVPATA